MILNIGTSLNLMFCNYCCLRVPTENNIFLSSYHAIVSCHVTLIKDH